MAKEQDILDAADLIERFVAGTCGPYEWDDFLNGSRNDQALQKIHMECEQVEIDFPARTDTEWCSPDGVPALLGIAIRIRDELAGSSRVSEKITLSEKASQNSQHDPSCNPCQPVSPDDFTKIMPRRRMPVLHRALLSFGCILVGWTIMIACLFWRYYAHADDSPRWHAMPMIIAATSWKFVLPTWLLLVLPLFILVRNESGFWNAFVCVPLLAVVGLLIMAASSGFNDSYPFNLLWGLAAICGGSTGLASSIVHRHFAARIEQAQDAPCGPC